LFENGEIQDIGFQLIFNNFEANLIVGAQSLDVNSGQRIYPLLGKGDIGRNGYTIRNFEPVIIFAINNTDCLGWMLFPIGI